jgi:hypothetical protein
MAQQPDQDIDSHGLRVLAASIALADDDDGWTYKTRTVGASLVIDVYDETGEYVGTL